MEVIKILHLSPTDIRYDSRILKELNAIRKIDGFSINAYGIMDEEGHKYVNNDNSITVFKIKSKNFLILPRSIRYLFMSIESFIKILYPIFKLKPKVLHCHDTLFLPIGVICKIFLSCTLIYDAHELESNKAGQNKILSYATLFIEKLSWKHISLLITVSPSIEKWYLNKFGFKPSLLIMNSPLIECNLIKKKSNYLREYFRIPETSKIYLYNGILSKNGRSIQLYLDFFAKPNVNSHLVFLGYGEFKSEILEYEKLYNNIHYHPAVPHDDIVNVSSSADIGLCMIEQVSLSDYYALPNKLFEYAFSGLSIIASNFPDIKEIVDNYSLGICSDLNIQSFKKAIDSLESGSIIKKDVNLYPLSWEYQESQLITQYSKFLN